MNAFEKERFENGELPALLHRFDLAIYSCWVIINGQQNDKIELVFGGKRLTFPEGRFFLDCTLDGACVTARNLLQFLGVGLAKGKLDQHSGRSSDIKITDWNGGTLLAPRVATSILQPEFTPDEIEKCFVKTHQIADKAIAHLTAETITHRKENIFETGICFWAVRKLMEKHFYDALLMKPAPKVWLPPGFVPPTNQPPWKT